MNIFVHLQKVGTTSPIQTASHLHGNYKYCNKTQALLQNLWILHAITLSSIPSQCSFAYSQAHNPGRYCIIGGKSRARNSISFGVMIHRYTHTHTLAHPFTGDSLIIYNPYATLATLTSIGCLSSKFQIVVEMAGW